jgi:hypothetical protein
MRRWLLYAMILSGIVVVSMPVSAAQGIASGDRFLRACAEVDPAQGSCVYDAQTGRYLGFTRFDKLIVPLSPTEKAARSEAARKRAEQLKAQEEERFAKLKAEILAEADTQAQAKVQAAEAKATVAQLALGRENEELRKRLDQALTQRDDGTWFKVALLLLLAAGVAGVFRISSRVHRLGEIIAEEATYIQMLLRKSRGSLRRLAKTMHQWHRDDHPVKLVDPPPNGKKTTDGPLTQRIAGVDTMDVRPHKPTPPAPPEPKPVAEARQVPQAVPDASTPDTSTTVVEMTEEELLQEQQAAAAALTGDPDRFVDPKTIDRTYEEAHTNKESAA